MAVMRIPERSALNSAGTYATGRVATVITGLSRTVAASKADVDQLPSLPNQDLILVD
jgi:hypothetical protein